MYSYIVSNKIKKYNNAAVEKFLGKSICGWKKNRNLYGKVYTELEDRKCLSDKDVSQCL